MRLAFAALLLVSNAASALPTLSQEGCLIFADAAVVARSLALSGVNENTALDAMRKIYDEGLHPYLPDISNAAYVPVEKRDAKEFAQALIQVCYTQGGKLDSFLGEKS